MTRDKGTVTSLDVWRTEKAGYSIDHFYTRSKDQKGHSTVYHVKVPDDVAGAISAIVQSGKIPALRTAGDVFRDALIHRLHWLAENMDALPNVESIRDAITRIAVENKSLQYAEEIRSYNEMLEHVQASCDLALEAQDFEELSTYLSDQRELAEAMREPFRSRMVALLDRYEEKLRLLSQE